MIFQLILNAMLHGVVNETFSSAERNNIFDFGFKCRDRCSAARPVCPGFTVFPNFTCAYFQNLSDIIETPGVVSYLLLSDTDKCPVQPLTVHEGRKLIGVNSTSSSSKTPPPATEPTSTSAKFLLSSTTKSSPPASEPMATSTETQLDPCRLGNATIVLDDGAPICSDRKWALCCANHEYYCRSKSGNLKFTAASQECESFGGVLASIHSMDVAKCIQEVSGNTNNYWIGMQKEPKRSTRVDGRLWLDETPVDFQYWADGQPDGNNGTSESWLATQVFAASMKWDDVGAEKERGYVCNKLGTNA